MSILALSFFTFVISCILLIVGPFMIPAIVCIVTVALGVFGLVTSVVVGLLSFLIEE